MFKFIKKLFFFLKRKEKKNYFNLGSYKIHRIKCEFCNNAFNDDNLVINTSDFMAHAECFIFIRKFDGRITTLVGKTISISDLIDNKYHIFSEEEWEQKLIEFRGKI